MMKPFIYGLILFVFLALPPVVNLAESIMTIHMHMQMPLIAVAGMLMTPLFKQYFPQFFDKWNKDGVPGILLALIVIGYWLIPRAMDDALMSLPVEVFKFISWAFLVGVPLMDSWPKLSTLWKNIVFVTLGIVYLVMAGVYIFAPDQLCNNYLIVEQRTLGWAFMFVGICLLLYFVQMLFYEESEHESAYFDA